MLAKKEGKIPILIGDLNAHMGQTCLTSGGTNHRGLLIEEWLLEQDIVIINDTEKCTGMWTRSQNIKQSIDYCLVPRDQMYMIDGMHIVKKHGCGLNTFFSIAVTKIQMEGRTE